MADPAPLMPTQAAELLTAALTSLRTEVAAAPAALLHWHLAPGEWCVKEVVGHLIEAEQRGFAGRIRVMLTAERPTLIGWDQVQVARDRHDCERNMDDLLGQFAKLRDEGIALVRGLKDVDLERGGDHPEVGYLRARDVLYEWVHHDRNHMKQIMANVQAFVWPHMGNAQRFSEP